MAICHPFLVQRTRSLANQSTFHIGVRKNAESKDNIDRHETISDNVSKHNHGSKEITNWFKRLGTRFTPSRRGNPTSLKKRTCHYLCPVLLFSILLNIPKFFEFETYVIE